MPAAAPVTLLAAASPRAAANDGNVDATVNLTFHFWSGTKITYYLTKSGTSVTGSTS